MDCKGKHQVHKVIKAQAYRYDKSYFNLKANSVEQKHKIIYESAKVLYQDQNFLNKNFIFWMKYYRNWIFEK